MYLTIWLRCFPTFWGSLATKARQKLLGMTGDKVNHGAGYGLEIPCKYRLYGPEFYIKRVKILAQVD